MKNCPNCHSTQLLGTEYVGTTEDYDGVSEFQCLDCFSRWGRWTGRKLLRDEIERRYGRPAPPPEEAPQ